jgi:hypothetical protein
MGPIPLTFQKIGYFIGINIITYSNNKRDDVSEGTALLIMQLMFYTSSVRFFSIDQQAARLTPSAFRAKGFVPFNVLRNY